MYVYKKNKSHTVISVIRVYTWHDIRIWCIFLRKGHALQRWCRPVGSWGTQVQGMYRRIISPRKNWITVCNHPSVTDEIKIAGYRTPHHFFMSFESKWPQPTNGTCSNEWGNCNYSTIDAIFASALFLFRSNCTRCFAMSLLRRCLSPIPSILSCFNCR